MIKLKVSPNRLIMIIFIVSPSKPFFFSKYLCIIIAKDTGIIHNNYYAHNFVMNEYNLKNSKRQGKK